MTKKALKASKSRVKNTQAKSDTAYVKPANRPSQYYNNMGGLWYSESMFCESSVPYRGTCANCGDYTDGFCCVACK